MQILRRFHALRGMSYLAGGDEKGLVACGSQGVKSCANGRLAATLRNSATSTNRLTDLDLWQAGIDCRAVEFAGRCSDACDATFDMAVRVGSRMR